MVVVTRRERCQLMTGSELLWTEPDQIASVHMEPFGTDPSVYTGPFWNRSETDPKGSKTGPAKQQV